MATSSSSCGPREGAEEVVKMMSQVRQQHDVYMSMYMLCYQY